MKHVFLAAMAAAALVAGPQAQAVESNASLSGFGMQLIDLDLNDGIAPFIDFGSGSLRVYVGVGAPDTPRISDEVITGDPREVELGVQAPRLSADALFSAGQIRVEGTAEWGGYQSSVNVYADFSLSPRTRAIFTSDFSTSWAGVTSLADDQTTTVISAFVIEKVLTGPTPQADRYDHYFYNWNTSPLFTDHLALQLVNDDDIALDGRVGVSISVSGVDEIASQVPEPASWLMLGAGLLGVGITCRKRRSV